MSNKRAGEDRKEEEQPCSKRRRTEGCNGESSFGLDDKKFSLLMRILMPDEDYKKPPLDEIVDILRCLSKHRSVGVFHIWKRLVRRLCAPDGSVLMGVVLRFFGPGHDQIPFVEMMRFEGHPGTAWYTGLTGICQDDDDDTYTGGLELESWMMKQFSSDIMFASPADVAVMVEGLLYCTSREKHIEIFKLIIANLGSDAILSVSSILEEFEKNPASDPTRRMRAALFAAYTL